MTAVEWFLTEFEKQVWFEPNSELDIWIKDLIPKAKEMEKEQRCYSEEDVRLSYQKGEEDSYLKGGQTKEMENEFIQSLKQKHQTFKSE